MSKRTIIAMAVTLVLGGGMSAIPSKADAGTGTEWKQHTAFDCEPSKILDGERYTYFLIHQVYVNAGTSNINYSGAYSAPMGAVLYYDKENPGADIKALNTKVQLGGHEIRNASYNPDGKYLLIVYADGVIDMVYDSGDVYTMKDLRDSPMPQSVNTMHITFPIGSHDAWIGTDMGYVHVDGTKHAISEMVRLNNSVRAICPVGGKLMAVVETIGYSSPTDKPTVTGRGIYEADMSGHVTGFSDFRATGLTGSDMDFIMPVSDSVFVTVRGNFLSAVTRGSDGTYAMTDLVEDKTLPKQLINERKVGNGFNYRTFVWSDNEHNVLPGQEGYSVVSDNYAYHIGKGLDESGNVVVRKRKFSESKPTWVGSWDFNRFWFYDFRKGFRLSEATGYDDLTEWSASEAIAWEGPVGMDVAHLAYMPGHGVLVRNNYLILRSHPWDMVQGPDLISGYDGEKWRNYSPVYNMPDFAKGDEALMKQIEEMNRWEKPYGTCNSTSWYVDSNFPGYLYIGTLWQGVNVMNLNNPTGQIMNFSTAKDWMAKFPGHKTVLPTAGWETYSHTRPLGEDMDGNMWFYYDNEFNYQPLKKTGLYFYCWTKEDRRGALEAQDVTKGGDWKLVFMPTSASHNHMKIIGLSLRHPKNRNKIVLYSALTHNLLVFDHNGTPDDTSDDTLQIAGNIVSADGELVRLRSSLYEINAMTEDPVTGKVLLGGSLGAYVVDPGMEVTDGSIAGDRLKYGAGKTPFHPSSTVTSLKFDEYNRLWIGTEAGGVTGLKPGYGDVFAHYTKEDSPLPSNVVSDVCWDPSRRELMIATEKGLVSVKPDSPYSSGVAGEGAPTVYPEMVTPAVASVVTMYNVPATAAVSVFAADGKAIRNLAVTDGRCVWDLNDEGGNGVSEGVYTFRDRKGMVPDMKVVVVR